MALLGAGCSVPEVDVGEDASVEASADVAMEATVDDGTSGDAPPTDASSADGGEAGPQSGCPDATPDGATTCCGSTPCVDHSGKGCNCTSCGSKDCGVDEFCCYDKHATLTCQAAIAGCR